MQVFDKKELNNLYQPAGDSSGGENGQITIIGGSKLFHGAPILSLKVASRINDMVFFASPDPAVGRVAELIKSKLMSFIWVPWGEVDTYIEKSDSVLIGPGLMRFRSERTSHHDRVHKCDEACRETRDITKRLLSKFKTKKWVIDAGSLQVMEPGWIPKGAIITPNQKEYSILFGISYDELRIINGKQLEDKVSKEAEKYKCTIVLKRPETIVCSSDQRMLIKGGNAGLTKGGTGDVLAGLTAALCAKNDAFLSACAASYITKKAGDELYKKVGVNFNADDLADEIPKVFLKYLS